MPIRSNGARKVPERARPREVRQAAGVSQVRVAALSGKALQTVRLFEADPDAVSAESKAALNPIYAEMARAAG